jgi:hypothetical protein
VKADALAQQFNLCLATAHQQLEQLDVTPERYDMAMRGSCTEEERASINGFEAYLRSQYDGSISYNSFDQITKQTMSDMPATYRSLRARWLPAYVVLYQKKHPN